MNCMKCGREIEDGQVFCLDCLLDMEKYPVKPGTIVQLPSSVDFPPCKRSESRYRITPSPEEQVLVLKRQVRSLTRYLAITLLVLAGLCFYTVRQIRGQPRVLPGQNYSAVSTPESSG